MSGNVDASTTGVPGGIGARRPSGGWSADSEVVEVPW